MTAENDIIRVTQPGTLKEISFAYNTIDWGQTLIRDGSPSDYGLYRGDDDGCAPFLDTSLLPEVCQLAIIGSKDRIEVLHSWDDLVNARGGDVANLHTNESNQEAFRDAFLHALNIVKIYTDRPFVAVGLGTERAVQYGEKGFNAVERTISDIRQSLFDGTPLDGSTAARAKPTDGIVRSSYPPTLLNPDP